VLAIEAYDVLLVARAACMFLTPLDPPLGIIPLRDPIVEDLGAGIHLTRDLFFSGHTATLALLAWIVPGRRMRVLLTAATVVVACLLLLQHVHYTVDVLVAPFCAYGCQRLVRCLPGRTPTR
jgi:PAP2 superfamily C-terminal